MLEELIKQRDVKQSIDRDQAYVLCSQGKIKINDIEIKKGDVQK